MIILKTHYKSKYIYTYLCLYTPPMRLQSIAIHIRLHQRPSLSDHYLFTCNIKKYKSEKYISSSNETKRRAKLNSRAIMIYGDSAAYTADLRSNM